MEPAGFEKYTDNKMGALNFSVVSIYLKNLSIMSVRATSTLRQSFLTEKNAAFIFFLFQQKS